ncbi:GNAT family N-acetyltransferase [candidate division WOR-3 bacterium]|nr:GNAT family N-acetyltransferase [candidate division WOR-3 bacterium]
MLEIKNLDERTIIDGFCVKPTFSMEDGFSKTETKLEEAMLERRRFLIDRLVEGRVWGKIAYKDDEPVGWIDYYPTDLSGWLSIGCIDVEESFRKRGVGRILMEACIEDCKDKHADGMAVYATVWEHMPKSFFKNFGFIDTDEKADISRMILKLKDVDDPEFPHQKNLYKPCLEKDRVVIDLLRSGTCPTAYQMHDLVKKAAQHFKDKVLLTEYATNEKELVKRFGDEFNRSDGIYINGESCFFGYPGELEKIVAYLQRKIKETEK